MSHKKHTTQLDTFKKFVRTHMPHFHHAWNAKVQVHVFRYTFIGLLIFFFVTLVLVLANVNTIIQLTTGSRASETDIPKGHYWIQANGENEWILYTKPQDPTGRKYVAYTALISNIYNQNGDQQLQFTDFKFNKIQERTGPDGTTEYYEEGIDLTDISMRDGKYIGVSRLSYIKEGESLDDQQALFTVTGPVPPDVTEVYFHYLEGNGANLNEVTGFKEEKLEKATVALPTLEPSEQEEVGTQNDSAVSKCQKEFGLDYTSSYWHKDDNKDEDVEQCNCTNGSDHRMLFETKKGTARRLELQENCNRADSPGSATDWYLDNQDRETDPGGTDPMLPPEQNVPSTDQGTGTFTIAQANEYCEDQLVREGVEQEGHPYTHFRGCFPGDGGNVGVCGLESKLDCDSNCGDERYLVDAPAALCNTDVPTQSDSEDRPPEEEPDERGGEEWPKSISWAREQCRTIYPDTPKYRGCYEDGVPVLVCGTHTKEECDNPEIDTCTGFAQNFAQRADLTQCPSDQPPSRR